MFSESLLQNTFAVGPPQKTLCSDAVFFSAALTAYGVDQQLADFRSSLDSIILTFPIEIDSLSVDVLSIADSLIVSKMEPSIVDFPRLLDTLVVGLKNSQNEELQRSSATGLANLARGDTNTKIKMIEFPDLLQNLVAATGRNGFSDLQAQASRAIHNLLSDRTRSMIVAVPGMLLALVTRLANSENRVLQKNSASALAGLAAADGDGDTKIKVIEFPGLLRNLVAALRLDEFGALQAQAALVVHNLVVSDRSRSIILDCPGLLLALGDGLENSENQDLQTYCASALARLACAASDEDIKLKIITAFPGLLKKLKQAMERKDFLASTQAQAACTISNLSSRKTSSMIVNFSGMLRALVDGMKNWENRDLQKNSAWALANLSGAGGDGDIEFKMIQSTQDLFQSLMEAMEIDFLQAQAARAVYNLVVSNRSRSMIPDFPRLLRSLVDGLQPSKIEEVQRYSASALASLACDDDIKTDIIESSDLLDYLLPAMARDDTSALQVQASLTISSLSSHTTSSKVVDKYPALLPALVAGLKNTGNQQLQKNSALAMANLPNAGGDGDVEIKMIETEDLLVSLITAMRQHDFPSLQAQAARVLHILAMSSKSRSKLPDLASSGLLQALVDALGNYENRELQRYSASALADLACDDGSGDIKVTMAGFPGLLENLVRAIEWDDFGDLSVIATRTISNLLSNTTASTTILGFPDVHSALMVGMGNSENLELQRNSARALASLAGAAGVADTEITLTQSPGHLQNLVTALERYDFPELQAQAARAISNSISDRTRSTILEFPGVLSALVVGLENFFNKELQEYSAWALANLSDAGGDVETEIKMIQFPNLLQNLMIAMGSNGFSILQAQAARAISNLLSSRTRSKIVDISRLLLTLVAGLENSQNQELQKNSIWALANLIGGAGDGDTELKMMQSHGLQQNLVAALGWNDLPALQAKAAYIVYNLLSNRTRSTIVDFHGLLSALVTGLENSENKELRKNCAWALANMSVAGGDGDIEIMIKDSRLLPNLVKAMTETDLQSDDDASAVLQAQAARAISNLPSKKTRSEIVGNSELLLALGAGLTVSGNQELRKNCAWALANLAGLGGDDEIRDKIIESQGLLQILIEVMKEKNGIPVLQAQAARTVSSLSSNKIKSKVSNFPELLHALVAGLGNSQNEELQENSAAALARLACDDTSIEMVEFEGLLESLVKAMGRDVFPALQENCARALANLAGAGGDSGIEIKIIEFSGLLQNLVTAMGRAEFPGLQAQAARAFSSLSSNKTVPKLTLEVLHKGQVGRFAGRGYRREVQDLQGARFAGRGTHGIRA